MTQNALDSEIPYSESIQIRRQSSSECVPTGPMRSRSVPLVFMIRGGVVTVPSESLLRELRACAVPFRRKSEPVFRRELRISSKLGGVAGLSQVPVSPSNLPCHTAERESLV